MRRLTFALLLSVASAAAFGQDASAKVTFATRAARAAQVLTDLGKAANVNLMTSPQTENEILIISAKDVPLSELMEKIATATSGEWRAESRGYRLIAAGAARTREENEALAARAAAIRKGLADRLAKAKAAKPSGNTKVTANAGTEGAMFDMEGPGDTTMTEIALRTDMASIAALKNGERVVFSTSPTRTQRPFAGNVSGFVTALVKEHNQTASKSKDVESNAELAQMPDFIKEMAGRMSKPVGQVSKAIFIVSRMGFGVFGMTQAELRLYDPAGKVALTRPFFINLPSGDFAEMMEAFGGQKPATKEKPRTSTPLELSADSKAFNQVFKSGGIGGMQGLKMPASIKAKIYRPDIYDPLSFMATDEVLGLAKKRNQPVVAVLSDDTLSMMSSFSASEKPTVEEYETRLAKGSSAKVVPDEKWLVIKPADPAGSRQTRLDRVALAVLLAAAQEKGVASLDDVAAYAQKAPSPLEGGLGSLYVMYLAPGAFSQSMTGFTSWETLRFYGSLQLTARQTLAQGGRIPFSGLSTYQVEQVRRMAFGSMPALEVEEPGKKKDDFPVFMRAFMGGAGDYRTEPTEILPDGLPGNGYVSMKLTNEPFASAITPEGSVPSAGMAVLDSDMLAFFKMMKEDTNMAAMASMMPAPDRVRIGQKSVMAFTFQVAPAVAMHQTLNDHRLPKDGQVTTLQNLPAEFQKLIAERQVALKKSPFGAIMGMAGMGMGGGTIRP